MDTQPEKTPWPQKDEFLGKMRPLLRWFWIVTVVTIISADIFLYSLHKADSSRIEYIDHRIGRLETMLTDTIHARENSKKIVSIETQLEDIEEDLLNAVMILKQEEAERKASLSAPKRKKRR